MVNPGAFATGMSFGWDDAERRRLGLKAAEMDLADKQRDLDASQALFKVLSDPTTAAVPYATPMPAPAAAPAVPPQPMPGQPSVPAVRPVPPAGAAPPVAAPGAAPPQAAPPQPPMQPPTMPTSPGGAFDVQSMARRIEAMNPGIDKATLLRALTKGQALLNPQGKAELQYMTALMRLQGQQQQLETRLSIAGMQDETKRYLTGLVQDALNSRQGVSEAGKDRRQQVGESGKDERLTTTEAGKDRRAAGRTEATAANREYNTFASQLRKTKDAITDLIRENAGVVPGPGSKNYGQYQTLKARRDALFDKMTDARKKAQASGQKLPSPAEAVSADAGSGGETLPDAAAKQLKEGVETTFANNQVWTLEGGKPKRVR